MDHNSPISGILMSLLGLDKVVLFALHTSMLLCNVTPVPQALLTCSPTLSECG